MTIYANTGETDHEKELFQQMLLNHDWLHGEWSSTKRAFVFEERDNPEVVIAEIQNQAAGHGIRVRCEVE